MSYCVDSRKESRLLLQAFFSDHIEFPLPQSHRFPISKYRMLRQRLENGSFAASIRVRPPDPASDEQLLLVHTPQYLNQLKFGKLTRMQERRIGFPWSLELVERSRYSTGATIAAARAALTDGVGVNLAGGTHHAFSDHGQGYCIFNDVAVAVRVLRSEMQLERAVIIDCDVHQGNGTADIFCGDESVFTFSIHGSRNFPFEKVPGDLDVALSDGTGDDEYLAELTAAVEESLPLDNCDIVFYLAGADAYEHDRLGRLKLTKSGLNARDRLVMRKCSDCNLPLVIAMAGGYAADTAQTVDIHETTVSLALDLHPARLT